MPLLWRVILAITSIAASAQLAALCTYSHASAPPNAAGAFYVVDGDTVILNKTAPDTARTTLRLVGINAPEIANKKYGKKGEPFGSAAKAELAKRLKDGFSWVPIAQKGKTQDAYDRTLAYLIGGNNRIINADMLASGMAYLLLRTRDTPHQDCLFTAQREARAAKRGLWGKQPTHLPCNRCFGLAKGRIQSVTATKTSHDIWLDTGVRLRINSKERAAFGAVIPTLREGAAIEALGYFNRYDGAWHMRIYHPFMLEHRAE